MNFDNQNKVIIIVEQLANKFENLLHETNQMKQNCDQQVNEECTQYVGELFVYLQTITQLCETYENSKEAPLQIQNILQQMQLSLNDLKLTLKNANQGSQLQQNIQLLYEQVEVYISQLDDSPEVNLDSKQVVIQDLQLIKDNKPKQIINKNNHSQLQQQIDKMRDELKQSRGVKETEKIWNAKELFNDKKKQPQQPVILNANLNNLLLINEPLLQDYNKQQRKRIERPTNINEQLQQHVVNQTEFQQLKDNQLKQQEQIKQLLLNQDKFQQIIQEQQKQIDHMRNQQILFQEAQEQQIQHHIQTIPKEQVIQSPFNYLYTGQSKEQQKLQESQHNSLRDSINNQLNQLEEELEKMIDQNDEQEVMVEHDENADINQKMDAFLQKLKLIKQK